VEVKPGYKQTDVGVIPEDWDVESMLGISQKIMDYRGRTPRKLGMNWGGGEIPALSAGNVRRGFIDFSAECYFGSEELYQRWMTQGSTEKGDVLFTTEAPLGNVALVPDGRKYILSQRTILIRGALEKALNEYIFQVLISENFQRILLEYSSGSTAKGIQRRRFEKLQIALPKLEEQRDIATALSDMDALLDGLDRLIAKKRAIKQATMQQLLTGQTRLPGFSGEWEMKQLGDYLNFLKNGVNSRAELSWSDDVLYLHYGDIHGSSQVMLDPARVEMPRLPRFKANRLDRLQNGDLIFADASEDTDGIGKSVEITNTTGVDLVSGLHTIAIRFDKSVLADGFKAYIQSIPKFRTHLRQLAAGTKVYATNRAHIASAELRLPGIDEQQAICSLLTDMETEIIALESRRTKTRALKQAMMQELLTGRTRLVTPDAKPAGGVSAQTEERKPNVHFLRSVLAAEIIDQLHDQPTFGHVKFEKMMFLAEHLCQVDTGSTYHRKAAGPYDNRALRSIDSQLQKQQWFEARKQDGRYQYVPLAKRGGHKPYFERYFSGIAERLEEILGTFKTAKTEQCEIVATLLAAWSDLLRENEAFSDEMIVHEVLHNWHKAKQRISEDRWLLALGWMREKGFVPKGATLP